MWVTLETCETSDKFSSAILFETYAKIVRIGREKIYKVHHQVKGLVGEAFWVQIIAHSTCTIYRRLWVDLVNIVLEIQ